VTNTGGLLATSEKIIRKIRSAPLDCGENKDRLRPRTWNHHAYRTPPRLTQFSLATLLPRVVVTSPGVALVFACLWIGPTTLSALQRATPVLSLPPASAPMPTPTPQMPPAKLAPIATLPAGLPLRVQVDHRYRMKLHAPVAGYLIDPVYISDHVLLPAHTPIYGKIVHLSPVHKSTRTWALLNGDMTPLKTPQLDFNSIQLPDGTRVPLTTTAIERTAGVVHMAAQKKKPSLWQRLRAAVHAKIQSAKNSLHSQHKAEWALRFLYNQLPYHPQDIWSGTQFDVELTAPLTLPDSKATKPLPITPPNGHIPAGTIEARLTTGISSATSKIGTPVEAVLTQPYMDAAHQHVLLPTGTRLVGAVQKSKPARIFGRNGTLRFTFRQVQLPTGTMERVHSQMAAVEGQKGQNIAVDSEGGAQANSDQGKFMDPLALGAVAGLSTFDPASGQGTSLEYSNGFGLAANVVSAIYINPIAVDSLAYYALGKSITLRWVMRGHNVEFPKDTRMELNIADR